MLCIASFFNNLFLTKRADMDDLFFADDSMQDNSYEVRSHLFRVYCQI